MDLTFLNPEVEFQWSLGFVTGHEWNVLKLTMFVGDLLDSVSVSQ